MKNERFFPNNYLLEYHDPRHLESVNAYLEAEREINKLFFYTKNVCRNFCHKKPTGCCDYNWYDYRIPGNKTGRMFKSMRKPVPDRKENNMCRFFSPGRGCILENLKGPVCIGMLCSTVCARLEEDFGVIYKSAEHIDFFEGILQKPASEAYFLEHREKVGKMLNLIKHKIEEDRTSRAFWVA